MKCGVVIYLDKMQWMNDEEVEREVYLSVGVVIIARGVKPDSAWSRKRRASYCTIRR